MSHTGLRAVLEERISGVKPPPGDLDQVRSKGRRLRRRRRLAAGVGAAAVLAVAAVAVTVTIDPDDEASAPDRTGYAALGPLDFSEGVRAYGDPGNTIHLGGRQFPAEDLEWLDTDAVATPYGIVFFEAGRPMLLDASGSVSPLVTGPLDGAPGFHPTAKADASAPLVAWATLPEGTATITVRDMETGEDVASAELDCGRCKDVVIDGIDGGVVFVRDRHGTRTWDTASGKWSDFAGPDTRVADVRNGVVLYDGPAPIDPGEWWPVAGVVDSQLSLDGRYVLGWSSRLEPTRAGDEPVRIEKGPLEGYAFWTFDTDGSVLVAVNTGKPEFTVYDCVLPSGACAELGPLTPKSGDPMFIGNDM